MGGESGKYKVGNAFPGDLRLSPGWILGDVCGLNPKWKASVAEKVLTLRRSEGEDERGDIVRAALELKVNERYRDLTTIIRLVSAEPTNQT